MKLRSIHNAKLRCGDYTWLFEVSGCEVVITQTTATNGRKESVRIHEERLAAFIAHLARGLQELREAGKKARTGLSLQELIRSL